MKNTNHWNKIIIRFLIIKICTPIVCGPLTDRIPQLTLEEKIGQLIMTSIITKSNTSDLIDDPSFFITEINVGGILFYNWANDLSSPKAVSELTSFLQEYAKKGKKIPLIFGIDQEGGPVTRLKNNFFYPPSNYEIGSTGNVKIAEHNAQKAGTDLKNGGIHINFAPVVDIQNQDKVGYISQRSFGTDQQKVTVFARAAIAGYHAAGVATTIKHFPGHGSAFIDSHIDLPIITLSKNELFEHDLYPFKQLAGETDLIMTGHLLIPALDPDYCATFSKKILSILREDLHFNGIIISDSLGMKGALKNIPSLEEAALSAFLAGCDLLIIVKEQGKSTHDDIKKIQTTFINAFHNHKISEERINESLFRILSLKEKYIILNY